MTAITSTEFEENKPGVYRAVVIHIDGAQVQRFASGDPVADMADANKWLRKKEFTVWVSSTWRLPCPESGEYCLSDLEPPAVN